MEARIDTKKDIIISFHANDRATAEWIFYQLRDAGYSAGMYLWNCRTDYPFGAAMRRDAAHGSRVVVLLSASYLCEQLTMQEWVKAASENLHEGTSSLFAVRFDLCDTEKFLPGIPYLDLVGQRGEAARDWLIARLQSDDQQDLLLFVSLTEAQNLGSSASNGKLLQYPFSTFTLTQLKAAGWREERRFDPSHYERFLEAKGYTVFPVVTEFLTRFGGLRIARPSWRLPGNIHWFHFAVDIVGAAPSKSQIEDDIADIQTPLCLIGNAYDAWMPMVMDTDGNVYISFEGLHYLGASGEDAIEALCTNRPIEGFEGNHL